jgi:hypothetical protein
MSPVSAVSVRSSFAGCGFAGGGAGGVAFVSEEPLQAHNASNRSGVRIEDEDVRNATGRRMGNYSHRVTFFERVCPELGTAPFERKDFHEDAWNDRARIAGWFPGGRVHGHW